MRSRQVLSLVFLSLTVFVVLVLALALAMMVLLLLVAAVLSMRLGVAVARPLSLSVLVCTTMVVVVLAHSLAVMVLSVAVMVLSVAVMVLSVAVMVLSVAVSMTALQSLFTAPLVLAQIVLAIRIAKHVQEVALTTPRTLLLVEQTADCCLPVCDGTQLRADCSSRIKSSIETANRAQCVLIVLVLHVDIATQVRGVIATHFELQDLTELAQLGHSVRVELLKVIVGFSLVHFQVLVFVFIQLHFTLQCSV